MLNKIVILFSICSLLIVVASCDHKSKKNSIVIKDCTGSYLQIDGSDFRICNQSKVEHIPSGTEVVAVFRSSSTCEADNEIVCLMYHEYEDDIRISKIVTK